MDEAHPTPRLPIDSVITDLRKALACRSRVILQAPPGTGKTTRVPLALLDAPWLAGRRILLLSPRRLAARTAARRLAANRGERIGRTVGYRIRLERRIGPHTRLEVLTEGVLTRMLQADPSLEGVGLVIFDEFHERSLEADLGLALCLDVQGVLNPNLKLLIMSATLDAAPLAGLLGNAALIELPARTFPVDTRYIGDRPADLPEGAVAAAVHRAAREETGSILAFLPGAPEIRRTSARLAAADLGPEWIVAPLHGRLDRSAQDAAILPAPPGRRKLVLTTTIAQTSLTIEGIRVVIDSGWQRRPRFDARSGMGRLVTVPVSRAAADQRRGRAGRTQPGVCYRLWSQPFHHSLPAADPAEILDADLAPLALELALWGVAAPEALNWLDTPPAGAFAQARHLLVQLDALTPDHRLTPHGRRMASLPLHPRLAHMVLAAAAEGTGGAACDLAALLGERDPWRHPPGRGSADLGPRLEALARFRRTGAGDLPDATLDRESLQAVARVADHLRRRLALTERETTASRPGRILAWAYPDRIALRRPEASGRFVTTSGGGCRLPEDDPLTTRDWIVAAELDGARRDARVYRAAAYDRNELERQYGERLTWERATAWDPQRQAVSAFRRLQLGKLTIERVPLEGAADERVTAALIEGIRSLGSACLPWTRELRRWQARVIFAGGFAAAGDEWPDLGDEHLLATLETWLGPYLAGITTLQRLQRLDLAGPLRYRLSRDQQRRLDAWAPTHWTVPSGSRRPIDYAAATPVLAVRLQEMFGCATTPTVAGGRQPLRLHLLSPAGRPVQITQDLTGFWQNGYPQVRKELRGRYPKHYWPDDPLTARPTAHARTSPGFRP